jgi:curved DNA-binding protein CbpA
MRCGSIGGCGFFQASEAKVAREAKAKYAQKCGAANRKREGGPWRSYHEVLGVTPDSSSRDIKMAYASKALKLHPDRRQRSITAKERVHQENEWTEVVRAYSTLRIPETKEEYEKGLPLRRALVLFYEQHNAGHITDERIELAAVAYAGNPQLMFEKLQEKYAVSGVVDPVTLIQDREMCLTKSRERHEWLEGRRQDLEKQRRQLLSSLQDPPASAIQRAWRCACAHIALLQLRAGYRSSSSIQRVWRCRAARDEARRRKHQRTLLLSVLARAAAVSKLSAAAAVAMAETAKGVYSNAVRKILVEAIAIAGVPTAAPTDAPTAVPPRQSQVALKRLPASSAILARDFAREGRRRPAGGVFAWIHEQLDDVSPIAK